MVLLGRCGGLVGKCGGLVGKCGGLVGRQGSLWGGKLHYEFCTNICSNKHYGGLYVFNKISNQKSRCAGHFC